MLLLLSCLAPPFPKERKAFAATVRTRSLTIRPCVSIQVWSALHIVHAWAAWVQD